MFCLKHQGNFERNVSFFLSLAFGRLEGHRAVLCNLFDGQGRPVAVPGGREDGPEASLAQLVADRVEELEGVVGDEVGGV